MYSSGKPADSQRNSAIFSPRYRLKKDHVCKDIFFLFLKDPSARAKGSRNGWLRSHLASAPRATPRRTPGRRRRLFLFNCLDSNYFFEFKYSFLQFVSSSSYLKFLAAQNYIILQISFLFSFEFKDSFLQFVSSLSYLKFLAAQNYIILQISFLFSISNVSLASYFKILFISLL